MSYRNHGAWTEPGSHRQAIAALPGDLRSLVDTVRGLLIHVDHTDFYGLSTASFGAGSRQTLPAAARLDQIRSSDRAPLADRRPAGKRVPATCRDYALLLCSFLRDKGQAARVRCGFADYLVPGRFEDHWLCEYGHHGAWRRVDAQLDTEHRDRLSIDFDTLDIPREAFLSANEAWRTYRSGRVDGASFGHGMAIGPRFLHVNLARDQLALQGCEVSEWDNWRDALPWDDSLDPDSAAWCDAMATRISAMEVSDGGRQEPRITQPFWGC